MLGATLGGSLGGALFPGKPSANYALPNELQGPYGDQIKLLQSLLGGSSGNALGGIQSGFGNLGVPQNAMQGQAVQGISQFLNQPSPEMRALQTSMPGINEMLTGTGPQFERDIAGANQQGARFGSGNEIMRGEALRNLFNMRNQTMNTLGMLSQNAGNADFSRLMSGFNVGTQQAQQGDVGLQRQLGLFGGLLGARQQLIGDIGRTSMQPSTSQNWMSALGGLAGLLPFLGGFKMPGGGTGGTTSADPTGFGL